MSTTIVATVGAANANSFALETEWIAYCATRLNPPSGTTVSGTTCTETEKVALVEAARFLSLLEWQGYRVDTTQALAWPRIWAPNPDSPPVSSLSNLDELYFDDGEIPSRVKNGQIELALAFISLGTVDLLAVDPNQGVILKTVGPLTTEWASPQSRPQGLAKYPRYGRLAGASTHRPAAARSARRNYPMDAIITGIAYACLRRWI